MPFCILEITAVCGELPAEQLGRLSGGFSYKECMVYALKRSRLLRTHYQDKLRGYRLGRRAKSYLLSCNQERFAFYLTGNVDTNLIKSEYTRRLRLHRIAETYITMLGAGVNIFRDKKPQVFAPGGTSVTAISEPAFYSSREVKELGQETIKIKGARMAGVLLAPTGVFLTYNNGSSAYRWDYRAELRAKALMEYVLCRQRLPKQYGPEQLNGLLLGNGMEPVRKILSEASGGSRCFFLLDGNYEHFYYLPNNRQGEVVLKILCDRELENRLNSVLRQGLSRDAPDFAVEYDATDETGNPVLFTYACDLPRIARFHSALILQERSGIIICFDFQREVMQDVFGRRASIQTIDFEKFERRFFP